MTVAVAQEEENVSKLLRIAKGLALPLQVVTAKTGILGETGSGKTTTAAVLVEELLRLQLPVDVIDPTDAWWGLKSSKDGKSEGFPVTVLGGDYGDVPLEETAGALIADLIAEQAPPLVISLANFTKGAMRRFLADFAERLYLKNRRALHLAWDEADDAAPQNPQKMKGGGERLYGALDQIVRRGRIRGLGVTMISQRSAEINKSILSQCSLLIAHRASHPSDVDPVLDWMKHHAKARISEVSDTIAGLKDGEAWVMSAKLDIFGRYQMNDRTTFNSSATPEPGEERVVPKKLAKPDLERLQEQMRDTIERAKANDPAALRRQVAELKAELAKKPAAAPAPAKERRVEVPVVRAGELARIRAALEKADRLAASLNMTAASVATLAQNLRASVEAATRPNAAPPGSAPHNPAPRYVQVVARVPPPPRAVPRIEAEKRAEPPSGALKAGARTMLRVLAATEQGRLPRATLATHAVFSTQSGTMSDYVSALKTAGYVLDEGDVVLTEAGRAEAERLGGPLMRTATELLGLWYASGRLKAGARAMMDALAGAYPNELTRAELADVAQISRESGTTSDYLSALRTAGLAEDRGSSKARATDALFLFGS